MIIRSSVSFVLPMYNEEANIADTVSRIRSLGAEITDDYEIVIVDDASTDNSVKTAQALAEKDSSIKVFEMRKNTKFGGAFSEGFKRAEKDVILYMDSDMPVKEEDIMASVPFIEKFDIVTGVSKIKKGDTIKRKIISGVYNFIVQSLFRLDVNDINSGYKVVRKKVVEDIDFISKSPFVDVELFLHAKKMGYAIYQFPLIFIDRTGGKSYIARLPVIAATFRDMLKVRLLRRG
ncbi:MAG: glycosyltransferase family 2 protein [Candidatus Omnitrophota bacterium]